MRTWLSLFFLAAIGACLLPACEPPLLTENGVVKVIGSLGLGPGEFAYPRGIAIAPDGAVFIVDKSGRVQRFSADGEYETAWSMPAFSAGKPVGLSVHPDGRVFVADTHYNRVMVFDRDGATLGSFGTKGVRDGEFELPTDVAFDDDGFIYVGEYFGNDRISKWSPDLQFVQVFGEDPIDGMHLRRPAGLAVDHEQTLWVADACNHRLVRFSLDGKVLSTFGTYGYEPGELRYPYDLSICRDGSILVCEYEGNRLQWFSTAGKSLRTWGRPGRHVGELYSPWGAAEGLRGQVYVLDSLNNRVQVIRP